MVPLMRPCARSICLFAGLLLSLPLAAAKISVPVAIDGVTTLTAEQVIDLAERMPELTIIDSRQRMDRKQGYIQGSISMPDVETDCDSLRALLPSSVAPVVFYCNGIRCGRSVIALEIAKGCGYTQLYWFRGGFEEWKRQGYPFLQM